MEVPHSTQAPVPDRFSRTRLLLGQEALAELGRARVVVFGLGGVGGAVVEALARCGVGSLDIVDDDQVGPSNLNRQIIATASVVGKRKVDVAKARILDINPACNVVAHQCFYLPATKGLFDFSRYDYIVDAVDTVTAKLQIISEANACGASVISSMGTANKLDPTRFEVADIYETSICPLAKIIRKECRKRGVKALKVVYSKEVPHELHREVDVDTSQEYEGADSEMQRRIPRAGIPGSVSFVPPVAGYIIAGEVVKDLLARAGC